VGPVNRPDRRMRTNFPESPAGRARIVGIVRRTGSGSRLHVFGWLSGNGLVSPVSSGCRAET
jgi:hypothetical protein